MHCRFHIAFQKHVPKFVTNARIYVLLIVRTLGRVLRSKFASSEGKFASSEGKFANSEANGSGVRKPSSKTGVICLLQIPFSYFTSDFVW